MYCPQSVDPPMRRLNGRETTVILKLSKCIHPSFFSVFLSVPHIPRPPLGGGGNGNTLANTAASHTDVCAHTHTHTLSGKSERERRVHSRHKICMFPRCSCQSSPRISHLSLILSQSDQRWKPIGEVVAFCCHSSFCCQALLLLPPIFILLPTLPLSFLLFFVLFFKQMLP